MIEKNNIPNGIIEEIKKHYTNVDFSNYNGILNENVLSRKLSYKKKINDYHLQTFIVRAEWSADTAKVYAILESGIISP